MPHRAAPDRAEPDATLVASTAPRLDAHVVARQTLMQARSCVVKVGSNVLAAADGGLDRARVANLAKQVAGAIASGRRMILVSSGAVAAGRHRLGLAERPTDMPDLQACAAVGQTILMRAWDEAFAEHQLPTAQLLLNRDDFDSRQHYLNIRRALSSLAAMGAVPIINENDSVSTEEIAFGDNDVLASLVANMIRADACIFLTSTEGLLDDAGQRVPVVQDVDEVVGLVKATKTAVGRGGMKSKLHWASAISRAGDVAVICNGKQLDVVSSVLAGDDIGTVLIPRKRAHSQRTKLTSRERWIAISARPLGQVVVDAGAAKAIASGKVSLLPVGVVHVDGNFAAGDVVSVVDPAGTELARGLCAYDSRLAAKVAGLKKAQVTELLGVSARQEMIHRDNLVVM